MHRKRRALSIPAVKPFFRVAIAKSFTPFLFRPGSRLRIRPFSHSMRKIARSKPAHLNRGNFAATPFDGCRGTACRTPTTSILRHGGINLIRPRQDSALQVMNLAESGLHEQVHRLGAAHSGLAMHHDLVGRVQFVHALGHFAQRDKFRAGDAANLVFMRLAHVDQDERVRARPSSFSLPPE